ncbi:MAG: SCO family protein [Kordiimonadaceae bacterium]|nr:SCO family protein [Kordiimonadaceae bacterium]MBO6568042.1 SCO family protein [Kordiimonadaceae bacterium]MBO6964228.1 SCO family protein [Kordiimonadaceae bacterium]
MKMVRLGLWVVVFVAALFVGNRYFMTGQQAPLADGPGGPFTLTSHTGAQVSDSQFRGQYMLVYFGYSFCPDVCPLDLQKMSVALYQLEQEGYDTSPVQPIFITIDPERDTVEELATFVPDFHPRLIALTGTLPEIEAVAREYKVYFAKRPQPGTDDYLMDHSAIIFAMDPEGQYVRLFSSKDKPADIADSLRTVLQKAG